MYRLLIVDDVPDIVDWLYQIILEDPSLELEMVKAYSGSEALEVLNSRKIDIVLSDIRMPGINGLQLLESIKTNWPVCKVIFLTGYNEFEYVYKAIQYEGVSYLLKTEDDEVILEALKKAVNELDANLRNLDLIKHAQESIQNLKPLLDHEFYMELLTGPELEPNTIREKVTSLGLDLDIEKPALLLMASTKSYQPGQETVSISEATHKLLSKFLSQKLCCINLGSAEFAYIWVIQPALRQEEAPSTESFEWKQYAFLIKGALESTHAACLESLNVPLSFVLDTVPTQLHLLRERYVLCKGLLNDAICMHMDILTTDRSIMLKDEHSLMGQQDQNSGVGHKAAKHEILLNYLERGMKEDFNKTFLPLLQVFQEARSKRDLTAMEVYFSIALVFMAYINRKGLAEKLCFHIGLYRLMSLEEHHSWIEAMDYLKQMADILFMLQESDEKKLTIDAIERIKSYIDNHLSEDLSLDKLADKAYFNPSYLSRLFRQTTGMKLSDYISEAKMTKAKRLLKDKELRVQDIALAVGFDSPRYFSQFFKGYTGMTPQDYRLSQQ